MKAAVRCEQLILTGLDGCNPLGFLAALGALRALGATRPPGSVRLSWLKSEYRPILHVASGGAGFGELGEECAQVIRKLFATDFSVESYPSTTIGLAKSQIRELAECWLSDQPDRAPCALRRSLSLPLLAAGGCEPTNAGDEASFSELSFANGQSGMHLLGGKKLNKKGKMETFRGLRTIAASPDLPALITECLEHWAYRADYPSFRWCPTEFRPAALQGDETIVSSVPGANVLAFLGLSFFPMVPTSRGARSTGMRMVAGKRELLYPLWAPPMPVAVIESLLSHSIKFLDLTEDQRRSMGILAVLGALRFTREKGIYFDTAQGR